MRHTAILASAVALTLLAPATRAQRPLAERVRGAGTATIAFAARARAETCGDGRTSYSDGLTGSTTRYYDGYVVMNHGPWEGSSIGPCEKGPVRVVVRVVEGQPSWLRTYVGPLATLGDTITDLGTVSAADARAFLEPLAIAADGRAALEAIMPVTLIDSLPRWSILERIARDSVHLSKYRRRAADLLARGAASTLPAEPGVDEDVRSTRREAVYALARQQPRGASVIPDLLSIATSNPHRDARVAALYQLGQMPDVRGVDLFVSMLRNRP